MTSCKSNTCDNNDNNLPITRKMSKDLVIKIFNLTEAGILDTQKTAKDLIAQGFSNDNISAAFVSPLPRTKQKII